MSKGTVQDVNRALVIAPDLMRRCDSGKPYGDNIKWSQISSKNNQLSSSLIIQTLQRACVLCPSAYRPCSRLSAHPLRCTKAAQGIPCSCLCLCLTKRDAGSSLEQVCRKSAKAMYKCFHLALWLDIKAGALSCNPLVHDDSLEDYQCLSKSNSQLSEQTTFGVLRDYGKKMHGRFKKQTGGKHTLLRAKPSWS